MRVCVGVRARALVYVLGSRDKLLSFIFPEEDPAIEEKGRQSNK